MTASTRESLTQLLANLHAERVATWRPELLKINIDQRQLLVDTTDPRRFVKNGDIVDSFRVPSVDGEVIDLDALLLAGPAVVIFFRFAVCPACNIALPYYHRRLLPRLHELGASLLALSPQVPERLVDIKRRHALGFRVASALHNDLAHQFGILYAYDDASKQAALARGSFIGDITGTGTWELPMPTVIVIDRNRVVRFVDVSPDWLARTEAEPIVRAVEAVLKAAYPEPRRAGAAA